MTVRMPPASTITAPLYDLPSSAFIILTAQNNNGKSRQIGRAISARVPGTDRPAVAPCLLLMAEASGEGTLGDVIGDPSLVMPWGVTTCDEAIEVLRLVFPEGRAPLTLRECWKANVEWHKKHGRTAVDPHAADMMERALRGPTADTIIRSLAVDSITTLHLGQMGWIRDLAIREAQRVGKHGTSGKDLANDRKRQAGLAAGPAESLTNMLSGIAVRHRGMLVMVACHTRAQTEVTIVGTDEHGRGGEKVETVVGEAPDFGAPKGVRAGCFATGYGAPWMHLHAKATAVWHLFATTPKLQTTSLADINSGDVSVKFGAITMRGTYPGLGQVGWPKRQGSASRGWLSWFDTLPPYWHPEATWPDQAAFVEQARAAGCHSAETYAGGPDLGLVLEVCLAQHQANARAAEG